MEAATEASATRLRPISIENGERLRGFFQEAGYNLDTLRGGLGFTDQASFRYRKYLLARTGDPTRLEVIVQWFTCGMPVSRTVANQVIPSWVIELCESSGLLIATEESLRPGAMLSPFETLLIASDLVTKLDGDASDLIVWPNATTYQMRNATISGGGAAVLDLGCGTGVLAVAAAGGSSCVTASDLNPRAAEFTLFNAALNGIANIECCTGYCFEPVAGRTFDLIVCNPPFFLVPLDRRDVLREPDGTGSIRPLSDAGGSEVSE